MLRLLSSAAALALLSATNAIPAAAVSSPAAVSPVSLPQKVLLVVSSHGRGAGETAGKIQPGFEMDELTQAWLVLKANGLAVDIASPGGGAVVADEFDPAKPYNAAFTADSEASAKLAATLRLDPAMAGQYGAILVIGGKGAMFDLPFSQVLHGLLSETEARGGVVAAVCHGPAVFARMRRADGAPWVQGRNLAGFTDEEEALFGKRWVKEFPFLLESEFRRQGARFGEAPVMLAYVATDGRVVTGQNPYSVAATAEAVVQAMGNTPAPRQPWRDEYSLGLVAQAIAGNEAPLASALARNDQSVDVALVAIWGFYRAQQAGDDLAMLAPALRIMELVQPYFPEPQLAEAIAAARAKLNQR